MGYPDGNRVDQRPAAAGHIPLGSYAGIPARAHWTLVVILALITQVLAVSVLPSALPGRHPIGYWLVAAGAAVAFLLAILAHEFAHAILARRYGIEVKHVTLWMLGGVTELGGEAQTPRAEATIAAGGPATSLVLGGAFAGLTGLSALSAGPELVTVALAWLAGVNLLLGVFNLLPGAPLDGGRILRAALWGHHRDRIRAAESSARAGTTVGMLIVGFGVLQLISGNILGLWLMLIGWFMIGAANGERQAATGRRLTGRSAGDIMTRPPVLAPSWWTVEAFVNHLGHGYQAGHVFAMVDFDGTPNGLLTIRDLQRVRPQDRDSTRLRDVARLRIAPLVVAPDTPLPELMSAIRAHGGIAVVMDGERAVGTINHADLEAAATVSALTPSPSNLEPDRSHTSP